MALDRSKNSFYDVPNLYTMSLLLENTFSYVISTPLTLRALREESTSYVTLRALKRRDYSYRMSEEPTTCILFGIVVDLQSLMWGEDKIMRLLHLQSLMWGEGGGQNNEIVAELSVAELSVLSAEVAEVICEKLSTLVKLLMLKTSRGSPGAFLKLTH